MKALLYILQLHIIVSEIFHINAQYVITWGLFYHCILLPCLVFDMHPLSKSSSEIFIISVNIVHVPKWMAVFSQVATQQTGSHIQCNIHTEYMGLYFPPKVWIWICALGFWSTYYAFELQLWTTLPRCPCITMHRCAHFDVVKSTRIPFGKHLPCRQFSFYF